MEKTKGGDAVKWYKNDIRDVTDRDFESYYAAADAHRRAKCDGCRAREDRVRSVVGDHLARIAVSEHCHIPMEEIRFARTAAGKPYAVGLDVHFNISHSGHLVVCAVSDRPVGIDVQQMRAVRRRLTDKVCTPAELAYIREAPGWEEMLTGEAMVRFFRVWTTKEAYFKWSGTGITDLKSFDTLPHIRSGGTFQTDDCIISIYQI